MTLVAAVGHAGQIGRGRGLPWHDAADLRMFRAVTMGGLCIVGKNTARTLPTLDGRDVVVWQRHYSIKEFVKLNATRQIFIIGGATIYRLWLPYVRRSIITHIDYHGEADTHMPRLWGKWRRDDATG